MTAPLIAPPPSPDDVAASLASAGYAFVRAPEMRALLEPAGLRDWDTFARSWDDLGIDGYMADGGRYRRRRFAAFAASRDGITRKPHQPHYQSRDYNPLNGGVVRWFLPVTDAIADHPAMQAVLDMAHRLFDSLTPDSMRPRVWHVEVHQFRITTGSEQGQPTPEGMHRDGVDWVLVMLVRRENVSSGETRVEDVSRQPLGSFTLAEPMDAAFVDDDRVVHGVTAIDTVDPSRPAYRDVLVVTLRRE